MSVLPGVSGSLFPGRFLAASFGGTSSRTADAVSLEARRAHFLRWWRRVEQSCGPATGARALFDLVAMPLAGLLGFRARDAIFQPGGVLARLVTPRGGLVTLVLLPWASRPSRRWRTLVDDQHAGEAWCLLVAPPFVSLVDLRGHAQRQSMDFALPDALDPRSFRAFWEVCGAGGLEVIDQLRDRGLRFQDAVREDLQTGVVEAIAALGPVLGGAHDEDAAGARFSEALTLVYRILFLLFVESRELVPRHDRHYGPAYAVGSLCREALANNCAAPGLWEALAAVTRLSRAGCDTGDLIVRPFNGRLFSRASAPSLEAGPRTYRPTRGSRVRDAAIARALVVLATRPGRAGREAISYSDLGVEQLGAVYERVLDLDPRGLGYWDAGALDGRATAAAPITTLTRTAHSQRRKETGTFYTPQPLADFVVRRTLSPLVRGAGADEILSLRVVDPAMGSGAFLVAACRYLAQAYESALVDEGRCAEADLDANERANIRRLVAARCLAGVDANPVAVQLARLSMWLTTLARDKPLNFFDHQLRVGNSLVGASPGDLWRVPDPSSNRQAPTSMPLFETARLDAAIRDVALPLRQLRRGRDDTIDDVRARERLWARISGERSPVDAWRAACDLWCARWFWAGQADAGRPPAPPEMRAALDATLRGDRTLDAGRIQHWIATSRAIARQHGFFHWPLEFADVFYEDTGAPRSQAGFDAVIGNPPWEMLRDDGAPARRDPRLLINFVRQSGLYPACDRGHMNLYQPFLERSLSIARRGGRVGLVLPWGLAADEGATSLRARLLLRSSIDSIVGLDNSCGLFPIHRGLRFMVLVASPEGESRQIRARFGVRTNVDIDALPAEDDGADGAKFPVRLTSQIIRAVGGPSLRIPDARNAGDLEWLQRMCERFPPLGSEHGWAARFGRELNATEDRQHFGDTGLPVIDGKHITPFRTDHTKSIRRIRESEVAQVLPDRRFERPRLAYRDVSGVGNRHTLIAAIVPGRVVTTHTLFCLRNPIPLTRQFFLCGLFNSRRLNDAVRMLMGGHVTTSLVENLPVPPWTGAPSQLRIAAIARRLSAGRDDQDSPSFRNARDELDRLVDRLFEQL